jgi:hypothetical protein
MSRARRAWGLVGIGYVVAVGLLAAWGFIAEIPGPILAAAAVTLPASVVALPGYYLEYGLLAQIPGANPSHSSGSGWCGADGVCHMSTTGDQAAWFVAVTEVSGVLALAAAAAFNVLALRYLLALRHEGKTAKRQASC